MFAAAAALLILPLSFFMSFIMAALVHEIFHFFVLWLTGVNVNRISVGPFGAVMETEAMDPGREVLCAMAGPVGSFLLVLFYRFLPGIALCAFIQGCFNLLPIYPLDGGRGIKGVLELMKLRKSSRILAVIQMGVGLTIGIACLYGFWKWDLGLGILILGGIVLLRTLPRKTPCKEGFFGVQ